MREFLQSVLGVYSPITYDTYQMIDEQMVVVDVIPAGVAGVDWLYVLSGVAFILCVYSVFRILGGLICKSL